MDFNAHPPPSSLPCKILSLVQVGFDVESLVAGWIIVLHERMKAVSKMAWDTIDVKKSWLGFFFLLQKQQDWWKVSVDISMARWSCSVEFPSRLFSCELATFLQAMKNEAPTQRSGTETPR